MKRATVNATSAQLAALIAKRPSLAADIGRTNSVADGAELDRRAGRRNPISHACRLSGEPRNAPIWPMMLTWRPSPSSILPISRTWWRSCKYIWTIAASWLSGAGQHRECEGTPMIGCFWVLSRHSPG